MRFDLHATWGLIQSDKYHTSIKSICLLSRPDSSGGACNSGTRRWRTCIRFLAALSLLVVAPFSKAQQPSTQTASDDPYLTVPLGAEVGYWDFSGAKVRAYEQGDKLGNVLVLPWFSFQSDANGRTVVNSLEGSGSNEGKTTLTIKLLVAPNSSRIKELLSNKMRTEAADQHDAHRKQLFASMTEGKIIATDIKVVTVSEHAYPGQFPFKTTSRYDFGGSEIPVSVTVPNDMVESIRNEIQNGKRNFTVFYRIKAKALVSESYVEVKHETICETDAFRDIVGNGGAIDPESLTPALITRTQKLALKGSILRNIAVTYDIQHPQDLALLEPQVTKYLDGLFKEQELLNEKGWEMLSLYGFSKQDITPDSIKTFVKDIKDKVEDHKEREFSFSSSASASFCGFGGSGSLSTSGKWLKDHKEEHNLALNLQGEIAVPKGLAVFSLDKAQLKTTGVFTQTIRRSVSSLAPQEISLSSAPTQWANNEFAELKLKLARFETLPIGSIVAWHKNLDGTPPLPSDCGWVECNGQTLSGPLYASSPYFDKTLPDLNNAPPGYAGGRFLRGGLTSGSPQGASQHSNWSHGDYKMPSDGAWIQDGDGTINVQNPNSLHKPDDGVHNPNQPRRYDFSRPVNMSVVWIMRVK